MKKNIKNFDVIIIGAGASGIGCANFLKEKNTKIKLKILEARDRIGGRVQTNYSMVDFPLELGGEFIHGKDVITHSLLKKYKEGEPILVPRYSNIHLADLNTRKLVFLKNEENNYLSNSIKKLSKLVSEMNVTEKDLSLAEYLNKNAELDETDKKLSQVYLGQTWDCDINDLSCEEYLDNKTYGDTDQEFRLLKGYKSLFDKMVKGVDIDFNCTVGRINWEKYNEGKIELFDENGKLIAVARNVVITVPVSLLKKEMIHGGIKHPKIA